MLRIARVGTARTTGKCLSVHRNRRGRPGKWDKRAKKKIKTPENEVYNGKWVGGGILVNVMLRRNNDLFESQ